ncbi:hypothetical protein Tco_0100383 [Tanacetum coccineum]
MEARIAPMQPTQTRSLPHVRFVVVPTTLSTAWKILNKPFLNMHPRVLTKREAITDRVTGALRSYTVKTPKLNVNSTSLVLSARSYPIVDPQCSSHPSNSINAVKKCSKETNHPQKDQPQPVIEIRTQQPEEPKQTLEDEFNSNVQCNFG